MQTTEKILKKIQSDVCTYNITLCTIKRPIMYVQQTTVENKWSRPDRGRYTRCKFFLPYILSIVRVPNGKPNQKQNYLLRQMKREHPILSRGIDTQRISSHRFNIARQRVTLWHEPQSLANIIQTEASANRADENAQFLLLREAECRWFCATVLANFSAVFEDLRTILAHVHKLFPC